MGGNASFVTITSGTWNGSIISLAYGGTGTSTFASGGVIFSDGTKLTQSASNFFWDNTNIRLGLNTIVPSSTLHIVSSTEQLRLGYNAGNYTAFTVSSDGSLTVSSTNNASTTINNGLIVSSGLLTVERGSGYVGIGTSTKVCSWSVRI